MTVFNEKLSYGQLTSGNTYEELLNLNDGGHFLQKAGTFKVLPGTKLPVIAQNQRRWGGGREVAEATENGHVEWTAAVFGTTEQECLEKLEKLLAQVEANPYRLFIQWQAPGASQPTLYEVRGAATWTPEYEVTSFEGAQLFLFQIQVPVAPLALGLPVQVYSKAGLTLPETLALTGIPGDAPCKAEVSIETGTAVEEAFANVAGTGPFGIAVNSEFIYFANESEGYIGRMKLNGTSIESKWLKVEATVFGVAVDGTYVYWSSGEAYIGRAKLNGTGIEKTWLHSEPASGSGSVGLAVNASFVYWTDEDGHIGRATISGGSIEKTWLATPSPFGIALTATHIYWISTLENTVGRAPLATPADAESRWLTGFPAPEGIAADAEYLYITVDSAAGGFLAHASLTGEGISLAWAPTGSATGVAVNSEHAYVTNHGNGKIARVTLSAAPVWALLSWASKPSSGLAAAPFGLLDSSAATEVQGWSYGSVSGARGGEALHGSVTNASTYWQVDPATMVPDSFSGELTVEVWARVLLSSGLSSPLLTLSAQPQDGLGYGAPRYTDEWGTGGKPEVLPEGNEKWRFTRLGTLHLLVNPLAPRIWKLVLEASSAVAASWGVDYLILGPSTQRACSPSGKAYGSAYPPFIQNTGPTVKTVRSDLSALVAEPGKNGHPDHGLGGQLLELPSGECSLAVKLSSLVPDPPTSAAVSPVSEQLSHTAKVTVTVVPRWFLARTA